MVRWLYTTDRTWLVVLDDVTNPAHLADQWPPHRPGGWTLATTRLREASLTGSGCHRVDIDTFTSAESTHYLHDRLTDDNCAHLLDDHVPELAAALGHLPMALSHAAAYILDQQEACGVSLTRYTAGDERLDELMPVSVDPDAYGRPLAVALLPALDAAGTRAPARLARPALALAAVCDPDGHPDTLWTTHAVSDYLNTHRTQPDADPTPSLVEGLARPSSERVIGQEAAVILKRLTLFEDDLQKQTYQEVDNPPGPERDGPARVDGVGGARSLRY